MRIIVKLYNGKILLLFIVDCNAIYVAHFSAKKKKARKLNFMSRPEVTSRNSNTYLYKYHTIILINT